MGSAAHIKMCVSRLSCDIVPSTVDTGGPAPSKGPTRLAALLVRFPELERLMWPSIAIRSDHLRFRPACLLP